MQATILVMTNIEQTALAAKDGGCYADLGCFPMSAEFYDPRHRPWNARPWPRHKINTYFELYNRLHPDGFTLVPWNAHNLRASGFNPRLETKIIVPGWLDNIKRALWVRRMRDALLWFWQPVNIIVVHWRNFTPYTIATANTRVVGAELANMIRSIEAQHNYTRAYHHIIGHSLGAHIAGYCGARVPGLGRITALDPARPFFQHMPKSVRLDRNDAKFVDAIHSDFTPENAFLLFMSFGMTTPVGHVDFYPNGPPLLQAGCLRDTIQSVRVGVARGLAHSSLSMAFLESVRYLTACDHQRSHEWFTESIRNRRCVFVGVRCTDFDGLIGGRCSCDDSRAACAVMGINADQMYLSRAHLDFWPHNSNNDNDAPKWTPSAARRTQQDYDAADFRWPNEALAMDALDHPSLAGSSMSWLPDFDLNDYLRPYSAEPAAVSFYKPPPPLQAQTLPVYQPQQQQQQQQPQYSSYAEQYYETTNKWYLKTNNRPNFCANQYQMLVYVDALRDSRGRGRLRANLIVSIIGSRGRLKNQRFVPRSHALESHTMQPFFIILDGALNLGDIKHVAIGWEPRAEPDPVQATISFESKPLEFVSSFWPEYKAKHPVMSGTYKYDRSPAYAPAAARRLAQSEQSVAAVRPQQVASRARASNEPRFDNSNSNNTRRDGQQSIGERMLISASESGNIKLDLHNVDIVEHLAAAANARDSVVIKQIVVRPLQAAYGRAHSASRLFCPPNANYRLHRDETVRLLPNIMSSYECAQWRQSTFVNARTLAYA